MDGVPEMNEKEIVALNNDVLFENSAVQLHVVNET